MQYTTLTKLTFFTSEILKISYVKHDVTYQIKLSMMFMDSINLKLYIKNSDLGRLYFS